MARGKKTGKAHHGAGTLYLREGRSKPYAVQTTDAGGKRHTAYFYTEDEAKEYRAKAAYEQRYEGRKPPDRRTTVYVYSVAWLVTKTGITPSVRATHKGHLERYLKESKLGRMKLGDVAPSDVRAWVKGLVDAGKSAAYIQHITAPVAQALRQAHEDEAITRNPFATVERPTPKARVGKALTREEVEKVLAAARADR